MAGLSSVAQEKEAGRGGGAWALCVKAVAAPWPYSSAPPPSVWPGEPRKGSRGLREGASLTCRWPLPG